MIDKSVSEKLADIEKNLRAPGMDECWGTASDFYHNVGSLKWQQAEHIALCNPDTMRRIAAEYERLVEENKSHVGAMMKMNAEHGDIVEPKNAEIDRLKEENEALSQELDHLEEEACSVDDELELRAAEIDRLKAEVKRLRSGYKILADRDAINWNPLGDDDEVLIDRIIGEEMGVYTRAALSKDTDQ